MELGFSLFPRTSLLFNNEIKDGIFELPSCGLFTFRHSVYSKSALYRNSSSFVHLTVQCKATQIISVQCEGN